MGSGLFLQFRTLKRPDPFDVGRKCRKWEAFFRCSKRNVRREELALDDSSLPKSQIPIEPRVADALVATELIDLLLQHFTERQQEMISESKGSGVFAESKGSGVFDRKRRLTPLNFTPDPFEFYGCTY